MSQPAQGMTIRDIVWLLLRIGVTVGALWYVVTQITWHDRLLMDGTSIDGWQHIEGGKRQFVTSKGRVIDIPADADDPDAKTRFIPGILTIFSKIRWQYFAAAVLLLSTSVALGGVRWQWLLQAHDLDPGLLESVRLTWMGFLSNNVLPGATGGDLVKAVSIARRTPGKRTSAVMTVLLDRVIGLVSLMLMGVIGIIIKIMRYGTDGIDSTGRIVLLMLAGVVVGGVIFFSRRVRDLFRIAALLDRIPLGARIKKIDDSLFHYRAHKMQLAKCIGIGLLIWVLTITCIICLGESISMNVAPLDYLVSLPVIFTAGAVAPSIAGLGVLEGLFQHFFGLVGASASSAVALCLLYRLTQMASSIPGIWPLYREFSSTQPTIVSSLVDESEVPETAKVAG